MRTIAHSWEAWRRIRAGLRAQALPSRLERQAVATLHLTDDVVLRSSTWARWQLGTPLPWDVWLDRHAGKGRLRRQVE